MKKLLSMALLVALVGCGPERVPVSGSVKYKDQPLANVNVMFFGTDGNYSSAVTDGSGNFANVTTEAPNDGAVPGTYKVAVTPTTQAPAADAKDPYAVADKPAFPQKYLSSETSKIEVKIEAGGAPLSIVLTD